MLPQSVIDRQVAWKPAVSLLRVLERHGVGPFPAERLNEPFGLAVGPGGVGPGPDVPEPHGQAGHGELPGDVCRPVVRHDPPALDPLPVEPGDGSGQKADHGGLLLVGQHLHVGEARGVIYCDVDLVVADPIGPPFLPVAGDPVAYLPEAGQGLDIDVDQVARSLPLVALHRRSGLQVAESPQAQPAEGSGNGGEGSRQQPGDVAQMQPLVTEIHGLLQLLRIECPALVVPNTPSIRKCRWTACAEPRQPLERTAQADPGLRSKDFERDAIIKMPADQAFPTPLSQAGIRMAMHGGVRSGLVGRTSTRSGLTPH